jgi:RNA polymerase sigma-70 factor (ECF subfamily)
MSPECIACFTDTLAKTEKIDLPGSAPFAAATSKDRSATQITDISAAFNVRSDEDLLLQVGNGSKEALSILFQRHARSVFNVARRILKDNSEAEDLLQELFLFVFQKARLFDARKGAAAPWIIQMTYHRAIDRRRYLHCRQHYNAQELDEERLHASNGQVSINEIAGRELLDRFRAQLSAEQRQTLELHFFEGYSFQEIAVKTGRTIGNVRNHYYRGLERLRSHVFPEKHA